MRGLLRTLPRTLLAAMALASGALVTGAQEWPQRTITIVVPLAAGTGMDAVARMYADELTKSLGKPVLIENQPGAALMLAAQNVAKAPPDGHTLLVSATLPMTANNVLYKRVNYDPERDFVPISLYLSSPFVVIVRPEAGLDTLQAFVAHAKGQAASPIAYASSGTGGLTHLTMELIKQDFGFAANHVPYRNSGQIITDVVGGHVAAAISETGIAMGLIQDGKLKALAISSATRHPQLPDVPTVAEAGKPGFDATAWHMLAAPAATPKTIVDRLVAEMARITGTPEFHKRVSATGLVARPPTSMEQMKAYIAAEKIRWSSVVKSLGLEGSQQ